MYYIVRIIYCGREEKLKLCLYDYKCGGMGNLVLLTTNNISIIIKISLCRYQQEYECVSVYIKYIIPIL